MMALNQILIAGMKPLLQRDRWDPVRLTFHTAITVRARKHKVPDPVEIAGKKPLKHRRDEVINVGQYCIAWHDENRRIK